MIPSQIAWAKQQLVVICKVLSKEDYTDWPQVLEKGNKAAVRVMCRNEVLQTCGAVSRLQRLTCELQSFGQALWRRQLGRPQDMQTSIQNTHCMSE